jgi:hypothetical protein
VRHLPLLVPRVAALDLHVIDNRSSHMPKNVLRDVAADEQLPPLARQLLRLPLANPSRPQTVSATNRLGEHKVRAW